MNPHLPDTPPPDDEDPASTRWYAALCAVAFLASLLLSWWHPLPWFGAAP